MTLTPDSSARRARFLEEMGLTPEWIPRREPPANATLVTETDALAPTSVATMDWATLEATVSACTRCGLCAGRTQTVFGTGDQQADWMLIGEAPGEQEDLQGEPFVGKAGKLLDNILRALDLSRDKNVYIANVMKCRPPRNRDPQPDEVAQCEPFLKRQIALVQPKVIVAMGRFAAHSLLKTDVAIGKLRGKVHTVEGVPVVVAYHPAYLLRNLPEKATAWDDFNLARSIRDGTHRS